MNKIGKFLKVMVHPVLVRRALSNALRMAEGDSVA